MKFIIKNISPSKTEIRVNINPVEVGSNYHYLFPTTDGNFDLGSLPLKNTPLDSTSYVSTGPNPAIIRLVVAFLKDFIGNAEASREYVLTSRPATGSTFGAVIPIVNMAVDDINLTKLNEETIPTIVIKLSEPLPSSLDVLSEISIEKQIITTQEQEVYYIPKAPVLPEFKGLDYDQDSIDDVRNFDNSDDDYKSFNDLTSSLKSADDTIIQSVLSASIPPTYDNLRIDYSNFENHVHYGSAVSKIENFKTKVKNIEDEITLISQSLNLTSSKAVDDVRKKSFSKIQKIKSSFSNYEKALYYDSDDFNLQNKISIGNNYANSSEPASTQNSKILLNYNGFNRVIQFTGSGDGTSETYVPMFTDKYLVEDKPFYNYSGSLYLSFLMKGDESINGGSGASKITWKNQNKFSTPKVPQDALFTSSLLTPNVTSSVWRRFIYQASQSYWAPAYDTNVVGYPGSITNFDNNSPQVTIFSGSKSGSHSITVGSRYTNLASVLTSSGAPFTGSILPSGELFRIGFTTGTSGSTQAHAALNAASASQLTSAITQSFITDVKITKNNPSSFKPFMEVYSTGSTEFKNWYDNQITSASSFDDDNIHSFFNNLPAWINNDVDSEHSDLKKFLSMMGENFDNIRNHMDNYRFLVNPDYDESTSIPDNLLPALANHFNWELKTPFGKNNDAELKNFLGTSLSDNDTTKTVMNNMWRNILTHIVDIYKSKGAIKSINTLLNSYGFPSSILKVREHGSSLESHDTSVLNNNIPNNVDVGGTSGNISFTEKTDKLVSYVVSGSNRRIYADWQQGDIQTTPGTGGDIDALELIFKPKQSQATQVLVQSSGSGGSVPKTLWDLQLQPSGSTQPLKARLQFRLNERDNGIGTDNKFFSGSTDYFDMMNGNFWNVLIQRTSPGKVGNSHRPDGSNNNLSQSYQLIVGEKHNEKIRKLQSVTLNLTEGTNGSVAAKSAHSNWVGTGSRPAGTRGNLTIGYAFTGSIAEVRAWKYPLSASVFKQHILDPKSVVGNTMTASKDELVYHYKLNENYISGSQTPGEATSLKIKDANPKNVRDYTITFNDLMTASLAEQPAMFVEEEVDRIQFNVNVGGNYQIDDNNIIIDPNRRLIQNLNYNEPSSLDIFNPLINKRKASSIIEIVRSPQDVLNDFITTQLGNFDFNDKFSDPRDYNKDTYKDLDSFAKEFYDYYNVSLDVNKYIAAQADIFNQNLINSIKRLIPARAAIKNGIELKPTFLDRQKVKNWDLERELIDIQGNINLTDHTESKYTHTYVGPQDEVSEPGVYYKNAHIELQSATGSKESISLTEEYHQNKTGEIDVSLTGSDKPLNFTEEYVTSKDGEIDVSLTGSDKPLNFTEEIGKEYVAHFPTAVDYLHTYSKESKIIKEDTPRDRAYASITLVDTGSENSKITLIATDGKSVTYKSTGSITAQYGKINGTIVNNEVLFLTGSTPYDTANNLAAAITASTLHNETQSISIKFHSTASDSTPTTYADSIIQLKLRDPAVNVNLFPTGSDLGTNPNGKNFFSNYYMFQTGSTPEMTAQNLAAAITASVSASVSASVIGNEVKIFKTFGSNAPNTSIEPPWVSIRPDQIAIKGNLTGSLLGGNDTSGSNFPTIWHQAPTRLWVNTLKGDTDIDAHGADTASYTKLNITQSIQGKAGNTNIITEGDLFQFPNNSQLAWWPQLDSLGLSSGSQIPHFAEITDGSPNNKSGSINYSSLANGDGVTISNQVPTGAPSGVSFLFQSESQAEVRQPHPSFNYGRHDNFSMAIWAKRYHKTTGSADNDTSANVAGIMGRGYTTLSTGMDFFENPTGQPGQIRIGMRGTGGAVTLTYVHPTDPELTQSFHHIAYTYQSSSKNGLKMYVDGKCVASKSTDVALDATWNLIDASSGDFSSSAYTPSDALSFGGYDGTLGGTGRPFNGFLYEPRVYSGSLTDDEVKFLYDYPGGDVNTTPNKFVGGTNSIREESITKNITENNSASLQFQSIINEPKVLNLPVIGKSFSSSDTSSSPHWMFSNLESIYSTKDLHLLKVNDDNFNTSSVGFTSLEKLQTSKNAHIEYSSATGSLLNITASYLTTYVAEPHPGNISRSFSEKWFSSYEDNDIAKNWGTASNNTHFVAMGREDLNLNDSSSIGKFGDNNTYHYEKRFVFPMIGDVETLSGSYSGISSSNAHFTDFTGTITAGKFTASKDFSNQTVITSEIGLGTRPVGTTYEFKASSSFTYKGKFLDEEFVYPPNHSFLLGSSKDDLDIIYEGTQNEGENFFETNYWNDLSKDAYYSITNTGQTQATITYE